MKLKAVPLLEISWPFTFARESRDAMFLPWKRRLELFRCMSWMVFLKVLQDFCLGLLCFLMALGCCRLGAHWLPLDASVKEGVHSSPFL